MPIVIRKLISGMVALSSGVRVIQFLTASFVPALFEQPYQRVRTRSLLFNDGHGIGCQKLFFGTQRLSEVKMPEFKILLAL